MGISSVVLFGIGGSILGAGYYGAQVTRISAGKCALLCLLGLAILTIPLFTMV